MPLPSITPEYRDVDVEGVGTIRMRPLTRGEVEKLQELPVDGIDYELFAIELALEDEGASEWYRTLGYHVAKKVFRAVIDNTKGDAETEAALGN